MAAVPEHVPADLVREFDFRQDPRVRTDPWAFFHSANALPDVFYAPDLGGHWVIARAELLDEAWRHPELFSASHVSIPKIESPFRLIPNSFDPPEHRAYQRILSRDMFAPRIIDALLDEFVALVQQTRDGFFARGFCDFAAEFARPVPVLFFMTMIGVPPERRSEFADSMERVFRGKTPELVFQGMTEVAGLLDAWLDRELEDRLAPREAHMLQAMLRAEIDGRPLAKEELSSIATMLMLGGLDTVSSAMLHHYHFLATHPEHREQLLEEPELVPDAVEELLRRFGIANVARCVVEDFEFHGAPLRKGEMVLFSTSIAGLDETRFPDALAVDFRRPNLKRESLAFGAGVHLCTGHHLARRELRAALEELLPRLENLRLAPGSEIEYASGGTVTIAGELPLVWG